MQTRRRIHLWSSPRNVSTALMYSFAQRADTTVVDEPLYAHYLLRQPTEADHPARVAVLASQPGDGAQVLADLHEADFGRENVVFKQMTHHLVDLDPASLTTAHNVLLIREPAAILRSFSRVVERVTARDIGLPQQYDLFRFLEDHGALTAIVDARRLLLDPPGVLSRLCARLGIPFDEAMLSWPAGPRPEDGVWAPHWYANVHRSTGFLPYREREIHLSPALRSVADACTPLYQTLLSAAL